MTAGANHSVLAVVAQILRETGSDLERLGAELCGDEAVAGRHMDALQAIDLIAQRQAGIAGLLEDQCRHEAVEAMTLEALQDRLRLPA